MDINIQNQSDIVKHYGASSQLGIAQEECAELIQAISKLFRLNNKENTTHQQHIDALEHLKEEMADVLVCINQIQLIFAISDEDLETIVNSKIDRQLKRIEKE